MRRDIMIDSEVLSNMTHTRRQPRPLSAMHWGLGTMGGYIHGGWGKTYMAGDSQDPGLRDEKIGGHDEMKGSWWRRRRGAGGQGRELRCHSFLWVGDRRGGPSWFCRVVDWPTGPACSPCSLGSFLIYLIKGFPIRQFIFLSYSI